MTWTQFLKDQLESAYSTTEKLLDRVDADRLDWKPPIGCNWMTMAQLLLHLSESCGSGFKAFVTGDWGLPDGKQMEDLKPEEMLPPAEKLPRIESVAAAKKALAEDKELALRMLNETTEHELDRHRLAAPWSPGVELPLGRHLFQMVEHLERHKSQLFYYLKMQGKPVDTGDLWGA